MKVGYSKGHYTIRSHDIIMGGEVGHAGCNRAV